MRATGLRLILMMALCFCWGGNTAMAAQDEQAKPEKSAIQAEESSKAKCFVQEKDNKDGKQTQPANVPPIKKDEGC